MEFVLGAMLLGHAVYTDARWGCIRNRSVAVAAVAGLGFALLQAGPRALLLHGLGAMAGLVWWPAVRVLGLGAGDAKLAMALGAVFGPGPAVAGPAAGFILCAIALLPWIAVRRWHRRTWRGVAVPLAPWIAAGTALVLGLRR